MRLYGFLILFLVFESLAAQSKLFLIAGQSNARGRADVNSSIQPGAYAQEYQYNLDRLVAVADPVGVNELSFEAANIGSFVPAFTQSYHEASRLDLVIVHAAKGGSALLPAADIGNGNWSSSGVHFGNALFKTTDAIKKSNVSLSGIIWAQGENEGLTDGAVTAAQYKTALVDLIARFRAEYGPVPFFIVEIGPYTLNSSIDDAFSAIRGVQREVAAEDPLTFIGYNKTENFVSLGFMKSDGIHYNIQGLEDIGADLGSAVYSGNQTPASFDMIEPAESANLELIEDDSIKFTWNKSVDVDQLKYMLKINFGSQELEYEVLDDTSIYVKVQELGGDQSVSWSVSVTDGIDTVQSTPSERTFSLDISAVLNTRSNVPELSVYPNPFKNALKINNLTQNKNHIQIIDLTGRQVINLLINKNDPVDLSYLKKGAYVLRLNNERTIKVFKK